MPITGATDSKRAETTTHGTISRRHPTTTQGALFGKPCGHFILLPIWGVSDYHAPREQHPSPHRKTTTQEKSPAGGAEQFSIY
ncbi:MAG: hypothetical protein MJ168_13285 [Clostridia bacterium]|nr:hypothetical protein [Clostridia bacterium]